LVKVVSGGEQNAACHHTARDANSDKVKDICAELRQLKENLAETLREIRLLIKSVIADERDDA
jgi:hypothetical protein